MCSSKKEISANQFARILGVDVKTGWFVGHGPSMGRATVPSISTRCRR
jgi:hypothetical protein